MQTENFVLRLPAVTERVGLCRASVYAMVRNGKFPRPIRLGQRAVGWRLGDIDSWIAARVAERDGAER